MLLRGLVVLLAAATAFAEKAVVEYRLRCNADPDALRWEVEVEAKGLDPAAGEVALHLPDWGEWTSLDSLLLRALHSEPPLRADPDDPSRFVLAAPAGWDGSLRVRYQIPMTRHGSRAHARVGLMPWWKDGYAHGFSTNTLVRIRQGGGPVDAERRVELQAPDGLSVATGWKGLAAGRQVVTLRDDVDNTAIFFGKPAGAIAEGRFEVVQFGGAGDVTAAVLPAVRKLVEAYGRTTGVPLDGPVRVFLADTGGGGVRVDHALVVGFSGDDVPALLPTLAHELLHHWLGGMLRVEDGMTWFLEGFTDYLSLWHLVHAGLVEPPWFADRLRLVEALARRSDAWGSVAFADPGVGWRDGDGSLETMAYRGGALLAFALDVDLRRDGGRGLPALVGDLLRDPERKADPARLRARLVQRGLERFHREFVEGRARPDLARGLRAAGFASSPRPVPLTYAGLATEGGELFGRIRALDPEGPAAKAGVRVGDRVTGFWPSRDPRPQVGPGFRTEYPYGLDLFAPGEMIHFGIDRAGEALQFDLAPRVVEGGLEPAWSVGDLEAVRTFFALG